MSRCPDARRGPGKGAPSPAISGDQHLGFYDAGVTGNGDGGEPPTLWSVLTADVSTDRPPTIEQQFQRLLDAYPWLPDELARRARLAKSRGYQRYGIRALCETVRWQHVFEDGNDGSGFKINSNTFSRLSRYLMENYDDLDGFFETRELRAS